MSDNNSNANLMLERANAAVLSRDYSLATRLYRTLLLSDPDNTDLLFALGDLYQKSGNDAKAIPIYKQLIEKNPKDVVSMNFLGSIYRRIKQWDDSIDILEKAVIVDETNMQTFYNLGFTYKLMGRNEEAIQCFNTVVEENPNDVLAYNHIGSIYASENEHDKAVSAYQRGLKIDPNHPILHLNMAHSYEKLGSDDLAANEYELALRSKPGWLDAIDGYADLLLKKRDIKSVSEMLSQAIRLNPQVASVHSKMGHVYGMQGNYVDAESEFTTALKINSKNYDSFADLAEILFKNGKIVDSIRTMKKGDEICADSDPKFMARYAELMMDADKLNAAGHKIKMLWEKDPDDIETLNLLGQYYICRGEDAKAEGCYQKIKKLDPAYMEYLVSSARRYNQTGRYGKAEGNVRKFLQADVNNENAMVVLADSLEKQNRLEEALDEYQKLAALDLDNIFYKASLERLAQAIEDAQEDFESVQGEGEEREEAAAAMDDLESQMRGTTDDGSAYDSNAIMPSFDFNDMDGKKLSQAQMIQERNRGYSFEGLTTEDHSMASPFSPNIDEEIMASNPQLDDFESLVPEPEKEPVEASGGFVNAMPSDGTGMGNGPSESLMSGKFLDEDIDGTKKVPDRTLNVSDGFDDTEDDFTEDDVPPARPAKSRPAAAKAPEPYSEADDDEVQAVESSYEPEPEPVSAAPAESLPDSDFDFSMDESAEDINQDSESNEESFEPASEESTEVSMEGDEDIFDSEEQEEAGGMEFSDEELVSGEEEIIDHVSDGIENDEEEPDNGYGFSFEDDDGSSVFDKGGTESSPESFDDGNDGNDENDFTVENDFETVESSDESETEPSGLSGNNGASGLSSGSGNSAPSGNASPAEGIESSDGELDSENIEPSESTGYGTAETYESPVSENMLDADENEEEIEMPSVSDITAAAANESVLASAGALLHEKSPVFEQEDGDSIKLSVDLFVKLKDLSAYLPVDKKQKFLESRENLQLEYLIKKLSGEAGLLETAHDIRERLNLSDDDDLDMDVDAARNILSHMKGYIESLPDQNIAKSLESEVDAAISKL
ncbi:MAG: tetratricopeptide repeat protein [Treponema sp.]|nr:tetratricopeptide repeat protein [Treponema sp.]